MTEKEIVLKGIKIMEDTLPSKWNPAFVLRLKVKFLPRLKTFVLGEEYIESKEDTFEITKDVFEIK